MSVRRTSSCACTDGQAQTHAADRHLDVVEARREDWPTDPFQFIEKDGYYYGRGSSDMKDGDAIMSATLIRMKKKDTFPAATSFSR